jgi:hypothetical protein
MANSPGASLYLGAGGSIVGVGVDDRRDCPARSEEWVAFLSLEGPSPQELPGVH